MRAFIRHFIHPSFQSRWMHCLQESPGKAAAHLHRFDKDHDPHYCCEMNGPDTFPRSLQAAYGSERGIYFDGGSPPCRMTAAEAATTAAEQCRDALLSLTQGKRALFFHHSGTTWRCEQS